MLSLEDHKYMYQAPWLALWPGLCLAIVVYGVNMFGDALRDLLDPRLRGVSGVWIPLTREKGDRLIFWFKINLSPFFMRFYAIFKAFSTAFGFRSITLSNVFAA